MFGPRISQEESCVKPRCPREDFLGRSCPNMDGARRVGPQHGHISTLNTSLFLENTMQIYEYLSDRRGSTPANIVYVPLRLAKTIPSYPVYGTRSFQNTPRQTAGKTCVPHLPAAEVLDPFRSHILLPAVLVVYITCIISRLSQMALCAWTMKQLYNPEIPGDALVALAACRKSATTTDVVVSWVSNELIRF